MKKKEERPLTNITRNQPDYYGSYTDSKMLANQIERYWKSRGYSTVRVWIEEQKDFENHRSTYNIRSNINFNVKDAEAGRYV